MCGSQALTSEATTAQDLGEGLGGVCAGVRWPGMSAGRLVWHLPEP